VLIAVGIVNMTVVQGGSRSQGSLPKLIAIATRLKESGRYEPDGPSIAGQWKAARGETTFNYDFKTDGTYFLQVKSQFFTQNKYGTWEQVGDKITVRQNDSGKPGTGNFSKGREIPVKALPGNRLQIDGDNAEPVGPVKGGGSGPGYGASAGATKCNYFVRDFLKELTGEDRPELAGQANDQIDQLSTSLNWESGELTLRDSDGELVLRETTSGRERTIAELQALQDAGKVVLYGWQHPSYRKDMPEKEREKFHGHIAVGVERKGDKTLLSEKWGSPGKAVAVPAIAQAGSTTFSYGKLSDGFGPDKKTRIKVFIDKKR
jgi:hypothetical protein